MIPAIEKRVPGTTSVTGRGGRQCLLAIGCEHTYCGFPVKNTTLEKGRFDSWCEGCLDVQRILIELETAR